MKIIRLIAAVFILSNLTATYASAEGYDEQFFADNDIVYYDPNAGTCVASSTTPEISAGELTVGKEFTLGTDNKKRAVNLANALAKDYNLKDFQAAGIVGNFIRESGGEHVPPDVNEGGEVGPPKFSGGYGWAQWTAGRQESFINYAVEKGYMASREVNATDAANYAYLNQELVRSSESAVITALKQTTTAGEAADVWEQVFERAGVPATQERMEAAERVLQGMRGDGNLPGAAGGETSTSSTAGTVATDCTETNTTQEVAGKVFTTVAFPLLDGKNKVDNPGIFSDGTTDQGGHPYIAYDIYAPAGTKVVSMTDGVVTNTSYSSSLGQSVTVYNEKSGLAIYYTHMAPGTQIGKGKSVKPGDSLGSLASVKLFPDINVDHLHIDASQGKYRVACSRDSCSAEAKSKFVDIGPDLFGAWEALGGEADV